MKIKKKTNTFNISIIYSNFPPQKNIPSLLATAEAEALVRSSQKDHEEMNFVLIFSAKFSK